MTFSARLLARYSLITALAVWGVYGSIHPKAFWILDGLNLALHEAGHPVFAIFGQTLGFLGGTLMQLFMPALFIVEFLRRSDRFGAAVLLFWFGENFFHIAPYIKDARLQALPLVGGGEHDWAYLLGRAGWLRYDQLLGDICWLLGCGIIAGSLIMGFIYAKERI